jgi:hypothetical protein
MSLEDKRATILSIYQELSEPLNLKEIEALASRRGVVQQSVKDVNQSLVDDNLVCMDKIGSSNFFWSFPLKVYVEKKNTLANTEAAAANAQQGLEQAKKAVEEARAVRCAPGREAKIAELAALQHSIAETNALLEKSKVTIIWPCYVDGNMSVI